MDERKIDSLIAEKIMNWKVYKYKNIDTCEAIDEEGNIVIVGKEFSPSTKIQDAWMVAEKLPYDVKVTKYKDLEPKYQGLVFIPDNVQMVFADTAPMAICLAALKAVGVEVNKR
ncbi:hypothetical protein AB1L05_09120 [Cytobacillus horneckiae]|uniref:BC1872 family protein n=1 Tax=Cytobacillus horneckiae TaxID=549687 RepID=UPI0039A272B9